jgi:hypothetical protein
MTSAWYQQAGSGRKESRKYVDVSGKWSCYFTLTLDLIPKAEIVKPITQLTPIYDNMMPNTCINITDNETVLPDTHTIIPNTDTLIPHTDNIILNTGNMIHSNVL